ncbi:MAG: hypothetical protein RR539_02770 [Clostridium sp.]|uniref:hypothetical protein n=1 Tax=Clostridium sp. TaxID=1506 RepID=UPI002FC92BED
MGIFSLFFKKSDSLIEEDTTIIETVETISNKIEVIYESGFLYKSENSYIPDIDIMEVAVPIAMDIFKDEYTVYSTEKIISSMMHNLSFNISIRKEIYLSMYGNYPSPENFCSIADSEVKLLDVSFIQEIIDEDITADTYGKLRQTLINTFNECGKTDPYFNSIYRVFSDYFNTSSIESMVSIIQNSNYTPILTKYESSLKYISKPYFSHPVEDIMVVGEACLSDVLSQKYNFDATLKILCNAVNHIHVGIQSRINSYENITSLEYLYEIENGIKLSDEYLITLIDKNIIDETTYLTIQDVLINMFSKASSYDLYIESITTKLISYIDKNILFKQYICQNLYSIFEK